MYFLYHYYESERKPFMNLSELSFDNAKDILEDLKNTNPAFFDLKEVGTDWFLNRRKYLEEKIRDLFIKKGDVLFTLINKREAKITESGSLTGRFYKLDFT